MPTVTRSRSWVGPPTGMVVAAAVMSVILTVGVGASPSSAAATTSTTTSSTTSLSTDTTLAPSSTTSSSSSTSSTSSTTSTTQAPVTVPPAGAPVSNLQLDAITAQFLSDVQAEVGAAQDALDLAHAALVRAQSADASATATLRVDTVQLDQLDAAQRQAAGSVQSARARLRDLAVDAYVSGGPAAPIEQLLSAGNINDFARRQGYLSTVVTEGTDALRNYARARDLTSKATLVTVDDLQRARSRQADR